MLLNKFYETIERAAQIAIPTTSGHRYNPVPWWNEACKVSHTRRKYWIRKHRRTKSIQDKRELNKTSAIGRKTKRQARRQEWKDFVFSINSNIPMSKIWKKVRKIAGKHSMGPPKCLNINGTIESYSKKPDCSTSKIIEMGTFKKFVQNVKKKLSVLSKKCQEQKLFFFELLHLVLNFHKDRFNNKKVFLKGVRSP